MAIKENETDFGQYLQNVRRAKEISLETVSRLTRISLTCLRQIESEDWSGLPASPYVKGFVKAYAEAVGADPQEALRRYENGLAQQAARRESSVSRRPRNVVWLRLLLALVVLAGVVVLTLMVARSINSPPSAVVSAPDAESTSPPKPHPPSPEPRSVDNPPQPAASESRPAAVNEKPAAVDEIAGAGETSQKAADEGQPPAESSIAKKEPQVLRLELSATEPVWVKVISDGQHTRELMLKAGQQVTLEAAERYSLLIGNAGGIQLSLNGRNIRVPGKSGQVVTLQLP